MAQLVLGLGSSHGPTIQSEPEEWAALGRKDTRDRRFDYEALLRNARPGLEDELKPEVQQARHEANQAGLKKLAGIMDDANLDVVVVVSNPHRTWADDNQPVFGIFRGDVLPIPDPNGPRRDPDKVYLPEGDGNPKRDVLERPGEPALANYLIRTLIEDGFDVGCTTSLRPGSALDEAFTLLYERFTPEGKIPMVPFMLSRYLPNQATSARCYALGKALGQAIRAWPENKRVGLMASGGLSHQIIDEELDRGVIDALIERDEAHLSSLDVPRLNRAGGTPEILNWVTVAGAMDPVGMTLVDYIPCYRSPAGTGHGVTFGYWQ
jgi:3-O-methylgallate 3,4-dioxygenase